MQVIESLKSDFHSWSIHVALWQPLWLRVRWRHMFCKTNAKMQTRRNKDIKGLSSGFSSLSETVHWNSLWGCNHSFCPYWCASSDSDALQSISEASAVWGSGGYLQYESLRTKIWSFYNLSVLVCCLLKHLNTDYMLVWGEPWNWWQTFSDIMT